MLGKCAIRYIKNKVPQNFTLYNTFLAYCTACYQSVIYKI